MAAAAAALPHFLCFNNINNTTTTTSSALLPIYKSTQTTTTTTRLMVHDHHELTIPDQLKEKILCLELLGLDSGRALSLNPSLHTTTLQSIHRVLSFLQSKGIHHNDLARILGMCPNILTSSITHHLSPVFTFLSHDLCVPHHKLRRVINKCPRLLISSVPDQLKPALFYLQRLGFNDLNALASQDSVLLVSSVERTLMPKLEYLQAGLGLEREEAVGMVRRCPGLFTFSIENNFKPKFGYFVKEMGGRVEELKGFPQYFAFSLEKRIKPRHREMVKRGMRSDVVSLAVMLKSTDEEFSKLLVRRCT